MHVIGRKTAAIGYVDSPPHYVALITIGQQYNSDPNEKDFSCHFGKGHCTFTTRFANFTIETDAKTKVGFCNELQDAKSYEL